MKFYTLTFIAVAAIVAGCAEERPQAEYHQPLTSPGGQFATVPPAVQSAVRAEAGSAEISAVTKNETPGGTVYEFDFKNAAEYPPLHVASDGSVLKSDLTVAVGADKDTIAASTGSGVGGVRLDDLPPNVTKTLRDQAPTGEVNSITRIASGSDVYYEIFFKDPAHHQKLRIADSGRLMR